ncbi:MAG TPA: 3-dehydroquinate synthase [Longimicrobiales bacterium]|nr:3-dehydroquinate synthase [Longimicrobiales bacterium]
MTTGGAIRLDLPAKPASGYDIIVEPGLRKTLAAHLAKVAPATRYALLVDSAIADAHGEPIAAGLRAAGLAVAVLSVPSGEQNKNRATWAAMTDAMLERGYGRDSCVLAVGGGVVGDLAGFVAATYMRGVPVVQVPTTLLAMVDASIGGKTGVDTPAGKNLVGAFHQPRLVAVDPEVLETLPDEELRAGLAETVKHGAIADGEHMHWIGESADAIFGRDPKTLAELIRRSVEIKASFVSADVHEAGAREALNFGHTIGHSIESLSDYTLRHGYAVSMGMVLEAAVGEAIGVTEAGTTDTIARVLDRLGLPVSPPPGTVASAVIERCRADKKARSARIRYTLIERVGRVARGPAGEWAIAVDDESVRRVLESHGAR